MRLREKKGFTTKFHLEHESEIVLTEKINKIDDANFMQNTKWNQRIDRIVNTITLNL